MICAVVSTTASMDLLTMHSRCAVWMCRAVRLHSLQTYSCRGRIDHHQRSCVRRKDRTIRHAVDLYIGKSPMFQLTQSAHMMPWFAVMMTLATWSKHTSTRAISKSG